MEAASRALKEALHAGHGQEDGAEAEMCGGPHGQVILDEDNETFLAAFAAIASETASGRAPCPDLLGGW